MSTLPACFSPVSWALAILCLASGRGAPEEQHPLAPDGRRGLGSQTPLQDLRGLVQSRKTEDEAFLAGLRELESELAALAGSAEVLYHRRGHFDALSWRDRPDLAHLHELLRALLVDPQPILAERDARARAAARILLDTRLRIRSEVLAGWEAEAATVAGGLLVLRAESDGWVRLTQEEASSLAARVDLSAADLRSRIFDLRALREELSAASEVPEHEVERLLALFELPGRERSESLARVLAGGDESAARARGLLFSTRLRISAASWYLWREEEDRRAEEALREVLVLRPDTPEGEQAGPEVANLSKTARRRAAMERALGGLLHDPLDPGLAYSAAITAELVRGRLEATSLFDRYLALRGIRPDDDRNWRHRRLTPEEDHALFYVQQSRGGELVAPPETPGD